MIRCLYLMSYNTHPTPQVSNILFPTYRAHGLTAVVIWCWCNSPYVWWWKHSKVHITSYTQIPNCPTIMSQWSSFRGPLMRHAWSGERAFVISNQWTMTFSYTYEGLWVGPIILVFFKRCRETNSVGLVCGSVSGDALSMYDLRV